MAFSEILQEWKDRADWTELQIADAVGVSRAAVNQWLNKKSTPALRQLPAIGKLLKRNWMELAAITIGEEMGENGGLSERQSSLLAQTSDLDDAQMAKLQAMINVLFPPKN